MRLVLLSDTHSQQSRLDVPDGDVLICAGDMTLGGTYLEIRLFAQWLKRLPHQYKIVIAGNHDLLFEQNPQQAKEALGEEATYLFESGVEIEGVKFWGAPWNPRFRDYAFNIERGEALREKWRKIPTNIDVLITHGPPQNILDSNGTMPIGDADLRDEVLNRVWPRLHVFGHVHEDRGIRQMRDITFVNASVCDRSLNPVNSPIVFDFDLVKGEIRLPE